MAGRRASPMTIPPSPASRGGELRLNPCFRLLDVLIAGRLSGSVRSSGRAGSAPDSIWLSASIGPALKAVPQSESVPADETAESSQRFLDVLHVGGVGAADKALATGPKRGAGHYQIGR